MKNNKSYKVHNIKQFKTETDHTKK